MKVHIALVGGQAAPVYHGIVATQPDKVVYVYSDNEASVRSLNAVRNTIKLLEDKLPPLDAVDPIAIRACARSLASRYRHDCVLLNISSGPKSWSHLFANELGMYPNVHIIYMDQNNLLWDYSSDKCYTGFAFDMDISFKLQNNPLKFSKRYADYTPEDESVSLQLEKVQQYNPEECKQLMTLLKPEWNNLLDTKPYGRFELPSGSYVEWEKPDFVRVVLTHIKKGVKEFQLVSPHVVSLAFNSGWFEYKIAHMLSRWEHSKDIRLNCIFPLSKHPNRTQFPKNEIDIIVNTGTKLLFVECKTKIAKSTDIDKFRTAVKNYGGTSSKALFITNSQMTEIEKEKCRESGIIYFSLLDPNMGPDKEQELFRILNKKLFTFNA